MALSGELGLVTKSQLSKGLQKVGQSPELGKPLKRELAGCRSIHIGGNTYRMVYRETTIQGQKAVEVIAIGLRKDEAVYQIAASRL